MEKKESKNTIRNQILRLLNKKNRSKWVVEYIDDWRTEIDLYASIKKLKELIKELK